MARKHQASAIDRERSGRGPTVDPVTFKGNSDPFNSLAIPIGASVSQLLEFARDYAVTALYGTQVDWRQPLAQQVRPKMDEPLSSAEHLEVCDELDMSTMANTNLR